MIQQQCNLKSDVFGLDLKPVQSLLAVHQAVNDDSEVNIMVASSLVHILAQQV